MNALVLLVLAQSFGAPVEVFDGVRTRKAWEDPQLVAVRGGEQVAPEEGAVLVLKTGVMAVWQVKDATVLRAAKPALLPVLRDLPSSKSRLRVPVGLICEGQAEEASWKDVLANRRAGCSPNYWYAANKK
ncbi:MAG: hypothetical protein DI536_30090 [Archangium gephyra]|uniref:Uncharacterized protein n=1 Tax=Archangium gephyra TaxID=48 RepID=A0A2W5SUN7_9BACT|nr:MAG: hypothetical protein DI536_30090 [Archangium gephyra]